jgi:uncharacterized protein YggT (Ycf19 family)
MFANIMFVLSALTNLFIFVCIARMLLGWFTFPESFRMASVERALLLATDWWFRPFRRIAWLRRGAFDFTATFAVIVLVLLASAFGMLASIGAISFGILTSVLVMSVWSAFAFFLIVLIILLVLRLLAYVLRFNTLNPFFKAVEALSDPALFRIKRLLFGKRVVRYDAGLIWAIVPLTAVALGGRFLFGYLCGLLAALPF